MEAHHAVDKAKGPWRAWTGLVDGEPEQDPCYANGTHKRPSERISAATNRQGFWETLH
jgi:hypothetical protein